MQINEAKTKQQGYNYHFLSYIELRKNHSFKLQANVCRSYD